jgi:two-component system, NarL family, sensor histidine kinase FusK
MRPSFRLPSVAMISVTRALVAVGFATADAATSSFASLGDLMEAGVLWSYAAIAVAYYVLAKRSWVFETRWLRPVHVLDWIAFALIVATSGGSASPYFPLFALVLFASSRALGVHRLLYTALGLALTFGAASLLAHWIGRVDAVASEPILARSIALLAIAYTGLGLSVGRLTPLKSHADAAQDHHLWADAPKLALAKAASLFGSKQAAIQWWDAERQICYTLDGAGKLDEIQCGTAIQWVAGVQAISVSGQCELRYQPAGHPVLVPPAASAYAMAGQLGTDELLQIGLEVGKVRMLVSLVPPQPMSEADIMQGCDILDGVEDLVDILRHAELVRLDVQTEERATLARNLHDSAIQSLASIRLHAASMKMLLADPANVKDQLKQLAAIDEIAGAEALSLRTLVSNLEPEALDSFAFSRTMEQLTATLARQWQIDCTLDGASQLGVCTIDGLRAADIAFVVREAVSNAVRHSEASKVTVRVDQLNGTLKISISDNGRHQPRPSERKRCLSRSVEKRMAHIGGAIEQLYGRNSSTLAVALPLGHAA